jgi:ERCC4-type nuclease
MGEHTVILVDDRAGSDKLIPKLKKIVGKELVKKTRLSSADAAWSTEDGKKWGVEVKHMPDVLKCIDDGRFVSQLRKMHDEYDEYWLLVVDEFRASTDGELEYKKYFGRIAAHWFKPFRSRANNNEITYQGLVNWLTTMEMLGGCRVWHVANDGQAARWLAAKYKWSQKKASKHKSLNVFDTSRPAPRKKGGVRFMGRPNEIARVANALVEGIGWDKARELSFYFASVEEFMRANEKQLREVKGIGKKLAADIVEARGKVVGGGKRRSVA